MGSRCSTAGESATEIVRAPSALAWLIAAQVTALSVAEVVRRSSGQCVDPEARSPLDRPSEATDEGVPQSASAEALKARVRAEYREMACLWLTLPQACRLWQLDVRTSASILDALVAEGFLRRTSQGGFRAAED